VGFDLSGAVDGFLKAFSSERYLARQERLAQAMALRRYAAAKMDPYKGSWGLGALSDRDVNRLIGDSSPYLRSRVRQLVRDFPIFARVVNVAVNLFVGTGIKLQVRVMKSDGKTLDEDTNNRIEDAWAEFCEDQDLTALQRLAFRQEYECGESFSVMVDEPGRKPVPMYLHPIEPDWLNGYGAVTSADIEIINGVEVNKKTGRVRAYWLEDPDLGTPKRVDAQDAIHTFQRTRPGQLRGVSPLVSAVLSAHDIGEYVGAEVEGAMMGARYLLTHNVQDPTGLRRQTTQPGKGKIRVQEAGRNIQVIGGPGDEFKLLKNERPGAQFEPTVNFITRLIAVVANCSYELISGDYRGINWSTVNGIRADQVQQARPEQFRFARQYIGPIYGRFLDRQHMNPASRIRLPSYWQKRAYYHRAIAYQPPTVEALDQLRQSRSMLDKLGAGVLDPVEEIRKNGREPATVLSNIKWFQDLANALGVALSWGQKPAKTNPAALMEE
jgi:lambda family phage portal protein